VKRINTQGSFASYFWNKNALTVSLCMNLETAAQIPKTVLQEKRK
jgi:hypothetical protein